MKNWIQRALRKPQDDQDSTDQPQRAVVSSSLDDMDEDEQREWRQDAAEISGVPLFEGEVKHGYSLDKVSSAEECPRCQAPTQQHYSNFIYATQKGPRVMSAPAGHFCNQCPTVVVDEDMIKVGIRSEFQFRGILGVHGDDPDQPDLFKTWNGQDAVYIMDEEDPVVDLATLDSPAQPVPLPPGPSTKRRKRPPKKFGKQKKKRKKR